MKFRHAIAAGVALATSVPAFAGDFQTLLSPTPPSTVAPLVVGSNNPNADRLYLETGDISFLSADVPSVIDYNAFARVNGVRQEIGSWTLSLIDYRHTPDVKFDGQTQPIGDMYDFVYRDSRDQKLVFGTRLKLGVSETQQDDAELNFIYRYGLGSGSYNPKAAWLFTSDADLRMYTAGRTASSSLTGATTFDADTVRYQSDVNLSEGNPYSGLFLLKTDAPYYLVDDRAVGFFQAGEEGQPRVGGSYGGFVPSTVPIPEPSTWALLAGGLGLLTWVTRKRSRSARAGSAA